MQLLLIFPFFYFVVVAPTMGQVVQQSDKDRRIYPGIMIIPYTKKNEDMRTILEDSIDTRVLITRIKENFDRQGLRTIDFRAKIKEIERNEDLTNKSQGDIKMKVINFSGVDLYVEVENRLQKSDEGKSVRIILTAYDACTSVSLVDRTLRSNEFKTDKTDLLVEHALSSVDDYYHDSYDENAPTILDDFVKTVKAKLDQLVNEGRSVKITFITAEKAAHNYGTEIGKNRSPLRELIESWIDTNAHNHYYYPPSGSEKNIVYEEVRIPLHDSDNRPYSPSRFAAELSKYCNSLPLSGKPDTKLKTTYETSGNNIKIILK